MSHHAITYDAHHAGIYHSTHALWGGYSPTKSGIDLFTNDGGDEIYRHETIGAAGSLIFTAPNNILALGVDWINSHVFYSYFAASSRLRRIDFDGTNDTEILSSSDWTSPINPDIAVDPDNSYIFAADIDGSSMYLLRFALSGGAATTLDTFSSFSGTVAIAPNIQKVYLAHTTSLYRYNYDGSGKEVIYTSGVNITGLCADESSGYVFIGTTSAIVRMKLNGAHSLQIISQNGTRLANDKSRKRLYISGGIYDYSGSSIDTGPSFFYAKAAP